jgi:folate-dependent phosphoribosylglycinamide formyltransferase PurN
MITGLLRFGIPIGFVVYWRPSRREQYRRVSRKLRVAGILPTLQRICYALLNRNGKAIRIEKAKGAWPREYFVSSHNSQECQNILIAEKVDILLLATDAIIRTGVLRIPRIATLNAHPGWTPTFRGLGSLYYQLLHQRYPSVTVHEVDEGVDTGPVVLRREIAIGSGEDLDAICDRLPALQIEMFRDVIQMYADGRVRHIDTFEEPSSMTRGMPLRERKKLEAKISSETLVFSSNFAGAENINEE